VTGGERRRVSIRETTRLYGFKDTMVKPGKSQDVLIQDFAEELVACAMFDSTRCVVMENVTFMEIPDWMRNR
jgi:hypothetical protein